MKDYYKLIFIGITFSTFYIIIYNIFFYSPILGYDAESHYLYVDYISRYLPREIRMPVRLDTREFFNPPFAYLAPSFFQIICRNTIESENLLQACRPIYGTATQIFQSIMYIATIAVNLFTLKLFNNSKKIFNTSYLIMISLLAVNYRTVSMIRGENYILFFLSIFLYLILKMEKSNYKFNFKRTIYFGLVIGGLALSRQWAFFLFLPIIIMLFTTQINDKKEYLKIWIPSSVIGFLLSGWFYINLYLKAGSFTAFNMERTSFSFYNQPISFYIPTLENFKYLFFKPIRPHLDNQFFSILYSDLWGDYWGYFSFTSGYLDIGRNQLAIGDYFARVNIISIFTFTVICVFYFLSFKKYSQSFLIRYCNLAIVSSFLGYLLFAISFPVETGDSIKATYIIQGFHLVIFVSSIYFEKLKIMNIKIYNIFISLLLIIYIHNFQTFLSHFPYNFTTF
tara:strand:- start:1858 stop:3213 length:1356 start_codon:yes stop_codon:yes gene_type:complete